MAFVGPGLWAETDHLLLYVPFDGTLEAGICQGSPVPKSQSDAFRFEPGLRGLCAHIDGDCRYSSKDNFRRAAGTIALWVRPRWDRADQSPHYLFCLYGDRTLEESWARNRWSISVASGQMHFSVYPHEPNKHVFLTASVASWEPDQWHHVAATWRDFGSGRADAELCLYLDGEIAARRERVQVDVGPVSDIMDVGRDSDGSPDYAAADLDELYVYGRSLSAEEIDKAVQLVKGTEPEPALEPVEGKWRQGWWHDAWRFRCRVRADGTDRDVAARLPLDFQSDIAGLGIKGAIDPASVRVVSCDLEGAECSRTARPVPMAFEENAVVWCVGREPQQFHVYFGLIRMDAATPLFARKQRRIWPLPSEAGTIPAPDYATDTYGDPWDFDEDDFEGIDQWGNRPWCLKNRKVENGVLSFDVSEDPWFIWGNMWGQIDASQRPVAIDIAKYPVLKMKVRQSCAAAEWTLYGRTDHPGLLHYDFPVTGQGWQIVRVSLRRDARWKGILRAFRIDPTSKIEDAHIELDWVRLTRQVGASRHVVEALGNADLPVAKLDVQVERKQAQVGSQQIVTVIATDRAGAPVAGQPVTVRLTTKLNGELAQNPAYRTLALDARTRRGLTDAKGRLTVTLVSSRVAATAASVVGATADFTAVSSTSIVLGALAGTAHHYRVTPPRPIYAALVEFPRPVVAQLVDEFGNPLPIAGRQIRLATQPGATLSPAQLVTDASGRAQTTLQVDPAKRWVYWIEAADAQGLKGKSGKISIALVEPRPNPIKVLPNGYFAFADGKPFVPLGGFYANWVQKPTPDGEWRDLKPFHDTTDQDKREWMKFLHDNGVNSLRFMLRTHHRRGPKTGTEALDIGGRVNRWLFAEILRYLDLGREFDMKFQLTVHDDYTKIVYYHAQHFEQFSRPAFEGEDLDKLPAPQRRFIRDRKLLDLASEKYTDPDAIACQDRYARELATILRGNPQVLCYELENEMVSCPASWANHACDVLRRADPATLVGVSHGGGGLFTADPLWWRRNVSSDYYDYHLYPHGRITTPEIDYGAAVDMLTRYGRLCGGSKMGESSGDQFSHHPDVATRRWVMRDIIWMSLVSGNPGLFFWNARGSEIKEFKLANDAMAQLDLGTFRRAKPAIGIDVRHSLDDDKFFRNTKQGQAAYTMMGRYVQHFLSEGVDFDFTVEPGQYAQTATLDEFAAPEPKRRYFIIGEGWQLKYLPREDWREVLVYVRNLAGIEPWDYKHHRGSVWRQYLRTRKPQPLCISLNLPEGRYGLRIYDLDAQTVSTRDAGFGDALDLGTTDHDFAVVVKRMK